MYDKYNTLIVTFIPNYSPSWQKDLQLGFVRKLQYWVFIVIAFSGSDNNLHRKAQVDPFYNGAYLNLKAYEGLVGKSIYKVK